MTHNIKQNKYDIEIVEEEVLDTKHVMKVKTFVKDEKHVKQFNFSHDQTPGGNRESWKKHIRQWINKLHEKNKACKTCEEKGTNKFSVDK